MIPTEWNKKNQLVGADEELCVVFKMRKYYR